MNTLQALIADVVNDALDDVAGVDAYVALCFLREVTGSGELQRPGHLGSGLTYGPLKPIAEVTREAVYGRLEHLWLARRAVDVPYGTEAGTSLMTALNVVRASDVAMRVEHGYADAERAAMVGAAIAEQRRDPQGVEAQRCALIASARHALNTLASSDDPVEIPVVSASELMRAELVARLRGELPTSVNAAWKLMCVQRFLVDVPPNHGPLFGPLWYDTDNPRSLYDPRRGVLRRLGQLEVARRNIIDAMVRPTNPSEMGEWLATLLLLVLAADAAATVAHTFAAAETQAMVAAAGAHLRGDTEGIAAQQNIFRAAAAAAVQQLVAPDAPVEPKMIDELLHAQLA